MKKKTTIRNILSLYRAPWNVGRDNVHFSISSCAVGAQSVILVRNVKQVSSVPPHAHSVHISNEWMYEIWPFTDVIRFISHSLFLPLPPPPLRPANVCDNIAFSSFGFGCFQFPLTENWIFRFVWFASKLRRDYMACVTATWIVYHVSNGIQHVYMHTNVRIWTIDEMSNTELPIEKCRSVFFFSHIFADPHGIP